MGDAEKEVENPQASPQAVPLRTQCMAEPRVDLCSMRSYGIRSPYSDAWESQFEMIRGDGLVG